MTQRDYTLIIDRSGSMSTPDQTEGRTRWLEVQESTLALAKKCEELDPDGITVYIFSSRFKRYDNVTADKVEQIFQENTPMGTTNLADVLQDAIENYLQRKAAAAAQEGGERMMVVTDGEPNDEQAVIDVIIQATQTLENETELRVSFIQVGDDLMATQFLETLDDKLHEVGAQFDICDTTTIEDLADTSLTDILLRAIEASNQL